MRYYYFILALIINLPILAQKVKLQGNNLCVDNEHWGYLTEKWSKSGHNTLVFTGLDGIKWLEAQYLNKITDGETKGLYKIIFYPQNRYVYYKEGMELKNSLCAQLVKSGAITKTGTYDRGIDKFEKNFGTQLPEKANNAKIPNGKYKVSIVERNRSAAFFVSNGQIRQDFKLIGTYTEEYIERNDSFFCKVIFLDINGIELAKAEFEKENAETAFLKINNYKELLTINLNKGTREMKIQEIVQQLIYLKKI